MYRINIKQKKKLFNKQKQKKKVKRDSAYIISKHSAMFFLVSFGKKILPMHILDIKTKTTKNLHPHTYTQKCLPWILFDLV